MLYARRVRSNIQSPDGRVWSVELGSKTCVHGDNSEGKDRIHRAITFALGGFVTDGPGSDSISGAGRLMGLAAGRAGKLFSEVELSDGRWVKRETEGGGGRASDPDLTAPEDLDLVPDKVFPMRAWRDAVFGHKPEQARRYLLRIAARGLKPAEVLAEVPSDKLALFWTLAPSGEAAFLADPVEGFLAVREAAKVQAKVKRDVAKGAEAVLEQAGQGMPTPPSDQELGAAQEAKRDAQAKLDEANREAGGLWNQIQRAGYKDGVPVTQEQVDGHVAIAVQRVEAAKEKLAACPDPGESVGSDVEDLDAVRVKRAMADAVLLVAKAHAHKGLKKCGICATEVGAERLKQRAVELEKAVQATKSKAADGARARQEHKDAEAALGVARDRLGRLREAQKALPALLAAQEAAKAARTALDAADAVLRVLQSRKDGWDAIQRARDSASEATTQADELERLREACDKGSKALLQRALAAFEAKVQKRLFESDRFKIVLTEGKGKQARDVLLYGLLQPPPGRPSAPIEEWYLKDFLCGAEKTRVHAAICDVINEGAQLSIVVPQDIEERALDKVNLAATMRALTKSASQVLLFAVHEPAGRTPAGWALVRAGEVKWEEKEGEVSDPATTPAAKAPGVRDRGAAPTATTTATTPDSSDFEVVLDGNGAGDAPDSDVLDLEFA